MLCGDKREMAETIEIRNCNCVKKADVSIVRNALNIKYGSNGTGKSTISKAILAKTMGDTTALAGLKPYGSAITCSPSVNGLNFHTIRVFDESYINSYLFQGNEFFNDSFSVFLRSEECERLTESISSMLEELHGLFTTNERIQKLYNLLPLYIDAVKYSDGNISKRGGVGEFIKGNGAGFDKYEELKLYKPYYHERGMAAISKWAKWRNDGIKQMHGNTCPFCAIKLNSNIDKQNEVISRVFKNSALTTASAVLEYLEKGLELGFINPEITERIEKNIDNENREDELLADLQMLGTETDYLLRKIERIIDFKPMLVEHDQLVNIEHSIQSLRIDRSLISKCYNTDETCEFVTEVENKIEALMHNTGKLKGLFLQHEKKLENLINERRDDINYFFSLAGFPYEFCLEKKGLNKTAAYLVPVNAGEEVVEKPQSHLSWGERNAFSLIMFMFQAISDDADLIVLDDPISAFDDHKKFAIIRRMFDNKRMSFKNRTVLMFTHDLQPVIDYIHGRFFNRFGIQTPVIGSFLQNSDGEIIESNISDSDLVNTVELTKSLAKDESLALPIRIVNLRKYIELTQNDYSTSEIYDILSNIIHGRTEPTDKKENKRSSEWIQTGMNDIQLYISEKDYDTMIQDLSNENLIAYSKSEDPYLKIIAFRLLFERHDGLLKQLRREYPSACKYLNETNHVENDYVFQLDPRVYFSIPEPYLMQLQTFTNKHSKELL